MRPVIHSRKGWNVTPSAGGRGSCDIFSRVGAVKAIA
jgi:hypothetical protein